MDFSKKQIGLLYLEKNKATLFVEKVEKPFSVNFSKEVLDNLELVDKDSLGQTVTNFITKNQLKPMTIFIVLGSEITFEKELMDIPFSLQSAESEKFLDMVPYHKIINKTYNFSNKTIIVAANKHFIDELFAAFSENSFSVGGIIPLSIFEEKLPQIKDKFNGQLALKKVEALKQYFLPMGIEHQDRLLSYDVPSFKNTQFVVLISIFALLLVILGVLVYTQVIAPSQKVTPVVKTYAPVVTTTEVTPSISPVSTPSAAVGR